ncbi:MAG TPA: 3-deoxy-7-phosphoheptulonate synthase, partial [Thermoanaerobaculia bacterium]
MEAAATAEQIETVVRHIERLGLRAHPIPGAHRTAIGVTGSQALKDPLVVE